MPLTTVPPYSSPISSVMTPMEKVRWTRRDLARKFGRYFNSRAAVRILLRVCSGMERAAAELFRTAETVPGVRPRCCATAFRVTMPFCFLGPEDLRVVISRKVLPAHPAYLQADSVTLAFVPAEMQSGQLSRCS